MKYIIMADGKGTRWNNYNNIPKHFIEIDGEKIIETVCNYDFVGDTKIVDVFIRYLRSKIDDGYDKKLINTVRGFGYVIQE